VRAEPKNMKKILYTFLALVFILPVSASAANFSFSPSTGTFIPGETFDVSVYVNPISGESITTAKLSALFSSTNLEIVSFAIDTGWIPLTQPGYDLLDNTDGKLIKTGGYPTKVESQTKLGVVTFKTKSAGSASFNIDTDSLLIDINNTNKFVISSGAVYTISVPVEPVELPEVVVETPTLIEPVTVEPTEVDETINQDPICNCEDWSDWQGVDCGAGDCSDTQLSQSRSRSCDPLECDTIIDNRCVTDDSCDATVPVDDSSQTDSNLGANLKDFVKNIPWWTYIIVAFVVFFIALLTKKNNKKK